MQLRHDIQGLRALGVLLIAAFHVWEGGVSGGVDVFFVVSGYLLGAGWLRRRSRGEPVDLVDHWVRFLGRTAPEMILALVGTLLLGLLFVSPFWWIDVLRDVAFSAVFLENYWLIWNHDAYLGRDESLSLVQHFWAVAIIGQVAFLWPLLARAAEGLAARLGCDATGGMTLVLGIATALSFGWSLIWTQLAPEAAYFDLATRFWQLGVGALLGLWAASLRAQVRRAAVPLSWLGLLLVLTCGLAIGAVLPFPGIASLWPVTAAALLLVAGDTGQRRNASRLLASRPLVGLGALSFGIYLWHWPLYVIVLDALRGETPSLLQGLAIVAAATLLAWLSRRVAPALAPRTASPNGFWRLARAGAAGLAIVAASAFALERPLALQRDTADRLVTYLGHPALLPGPFNARIDLGGQTRPGCGQSSTTEMLESCSHGSASPSRTVYLVGGSHSLHWLPALEEIADAEGWRLITMTKLACPFAAAGDADFFAAEALRPACRRWNTQVMDAILEARPDLVVTLATRRVQRPGTTDLGERIPDAFLANFATLTEAGIAVVAIRDTPWMLRNVPPCVFSVWTDEPDDCGRPRDQVLDDARVGVEALRLPTGVALVDMSDAFCDAVRCGVARDGRLIYRDRDHLTGSYARSLAPLLGQRIGAALRRLDGQRAGTS